MVKLCSRFHRWGHTVDLCLRAKTKAVLVVTSKVRARLDVCSDDSDNGALQAQPSRLKEHANAMIR